MSKEIESGSGEEERLLKKNDVSIASCVYLIFVFWTILLILDRLTLSLRFLAFFKSGIGQGILVASAGLALVLLWKTRNRAFQIMTSKAFAVAIMTWIMVVTALGTFVTQTASSEDLIEVYGLSLANMIYLSGINDILHSLWFGGLICLLALSLVLVVIKRKSWRFPDWGNLLSHSGVVVILTGSLMGYFFGFKGFMDLYIGKQSSQVVQTKLGIKTGNIMPLDFSVRLDDFLVSYYEREYEICFFRVAGDDLEMKECAALKQASDWTAAGAGIEFRVINVYPDYFFMTELKAAPEGKGRPGIQIELNEGQAEKSAVLFAGTGGRETVSLFPKGLQVSFIWAPSELEKFVGTQSADSFSHVITFEKTDCCPRHEIEVRPGGEYLVNHGGIYKLKVIKYFPDFIYDLQTRKPNNRSNDPLNPALLIEITETASNSKQEQWLFAKVPEYGKGHGKSFAGPEITYQFLGSIPSSQRELVLVGKTREGVELEKGKEVRRFSLPPDGNPVAGTNISRLKIFASAEAVQRPDSRSWQWENPLVELEIRQGSTVASRFLTARQDDLLLLPDEKTGLVIKSGPDDVKSYESKLAVIKDDRKISEKTVSVNHPLYYQGYGFYQSKYDQDDPTYSGILVGKDPGLVLVWIGFGMICAGMIFALYLKPIFIARRHNSNAG